MFNGYQNRPEHSSSIRDGGFWVCDRDRNCREIRGLWEADESLRERERGFDDPYASKFHAVEPVVQGH